MAVINDPNTAANIVQVGPVSTLTTQNPLHAILRSIPFGSVGHYRASHRMAIIAAQAANSRLFEIRNAHASNLLIPTALTIKWLATAAHTAAIEDSLDVFKATGFSAVDTTNTVTPPTTLLRTAMGAGSAVVRGATVAGVAAGMTGGTLTLEANPILQLPQWLLLAQPTGSTVPAAVLVYAPAANEHPIVLAPNEGLVVSNRVLLGAAAGSVLYLDIAWVETAAY